MTQWSLFPDFGTKRIDFEHKFFVNIISDRWSKYSGSIGKINDKWEIKNRLKVYCSHKYFQKATHNTYAYRIQNESGIIEEGKHDDGETGAGNCILRELQRDNIVNVIIVITRYFWWVYLSADRYRNVIAATKYVISECKV